MSSPVMQSPLTGYNLPRLERDEDSSCGVWGNEVPDCGYISLRGKEHDPAFVAGAAQVLGIALPVSPCTLAASQIVKVLWLSPDEWMLVCDRAHIPVLLSQLSSTLTGTHSQVVDNSGGYTQVELMGAHAADVLRHCSVYDVASLQPSRIVGTAFGKASVYIHREGKGFRLLIRRSFADYIWRMLVRAAEPYGFGVVRLGKGGAA